MFRNPVGNRKLPRVAILVIGELLTRIHLVVGNRKLPRVAILHLLKNALGAAPPRGKREPIHQPGRSLS